MTNLRPVSLVSVQSAALVEGTLRKGDAVELLDYSDLELIC